MRENKTLPPAYKKRLVNLHLHKTVNHTLNLLFDIKNYQGCDQETAQICQDAIDGLFSKFPECAPRHSSDYKTPSTATVADGVPDGVEMWRTAKEVNDFYSDRVWFYLYNALNQRRGFMRPLDFFVRHNGGNLMDMKKLLQLTDGESKTDAICMVLSNRVTHCLRLGGVDDMAILMNDFEKVAKDIIEWHLHEIDKNA